MSDFVRWPGGAVISGQTVQVNGSKLQVGLTNPGDLIVTDDTDDLVIFQGPMQGSTQVYDIGMTERARATKISVQARIYAANDLSAPAAAYFKLSFTVQGGRTEPAKSLIVRPMTKEVFGTDFQTFDLSVSQFVNMATYRPLDRDQVLDFAPRNGGVVNLQVFGAKLGNVERSYWLQYPASGQAKSVMVVISHGFGQNYAIYHKLGYENPFSAQFLEFTRDRFVLGRWGGKLHPPRPTWRYCFPYGRAHPAVNSAPFSITGASGARSSIRSLRPRSEERSKASASAPFPAASTIPTPLSASAV